MQMCVARQNQVNISVKADPRPRRPDQCSNGQWGDEEEVKAAVVMPAPPNATPSRPRFERDTFGQDHVATETTPPAPVVTVSAISSNSNSGRNMESVCCNNNDDDDYHHRRRLRRRQHEYELDGSVSCRHHQLIKGELEEVACRFDSLSTSNSNSTGTFMIDPPVWANSNTLMELPKIECPIQRVDESERKAIALATKLSLQSEKERQYNISRLQYNELQRTILQSRRELLLQRNQDEGDDIVEIVSQLSILSEEQRKLNCELYNLEMELDLDRSHHF